MAECPLAQVGTSSGVEGLRGNQRLLSEKRPKETKKKKSAKIFCQVCNWFYFLCSSFFCSSIEVSTENNEWAVWPGPTTNLTRASTWSPWSRSDPPFPPQWGGLCLGRSGTWCGSSALTDTPKLKHKLPWTPGGQKWRRDLGRRQVFPVLPSVLSGLTCTIISSWLLILDSLRFLGVEAWCMSSARHSMSSELHVRSPLRLITVRLGVLSLSRVRSNSIQWVTYCRISARN